MRVGDIRDPVQNHFVVEGIVPALPPASPKYEGLQTMSDDQTARVLAALERLEAGQIQQASAQERIEAELVRLAAGQIGQASALDRLEAGQIQQASALDRLEAELARLAAGQIEHASALDRLEAELARLAAGQIEHASALERLDTGQTQLRMDLTARIDRVQDTVETIRGDISVNFGRADQVQRIASNLRDDLRALHGVAERGRDEVHALSVVVNGIERQVRRLHSEVQTIRDVHSPGP